MRVWRLCQAKFASTAFTRDGAREAGGRWNSIGIPVVYTAESRALAVLEHRVNTSRIDPGLVLIPADLPDEMRVTRLAMNSLPSNWRDYPHPDALQRIGDQWARQLDTVALIVPSVVVPGDKNVVLNPAHPDFRAIQIGFPDPFEYRFSGPL
jgi:RES domain-containing protein